MAWDPKAKRIAVRKEIESSRDSRGRARAWIEVTPWGARERLAYENRMSEAIRFVLDPDNDNVKVRRVMPGKLRVMSVQLSVTGSHGFGDDADFGSEEWLGSLDAEVFEEVASLVLEVQPLPTLGVKKPADRKVAESGPAAQDDEDDEDGDGDEPDPTRRP